jgi:FeS assembly protein IscX
MGNTFHWLDVERIAEELCDAHPDLDPAEVNFVDLRNLVRELDGFEERPGHPVNERILEAIQQHWIEEREGIEGED